MKTKILSSILLGLALMVSSCGDGAPAPSTEPATGWVIGQSNAKDYSPTAKILKTGDGGATWTLQTLPADSVGFNGNDISAVNNLVAWAALGDLYGVAGGILHTADGGTSWKWQVLPAGLASNHRHIKSIKAVSPTEAWAVSILGDVLHTIDAGEHWAIVAVKEANGNIIAMQQVNRMDVTGQNIWIANAMSGNFSVVHSADAGVTWRQELLPNADAGSGLMAISEFDSSVAWAAVHNEGYLWGTSDGGTSWTKSRDYISGGTDFDDICASSANVVWVAQNNGISSGGVAARITVTNGNFVTNSYANVNYNLEGISAMSDNRTAWVVGMKTIFAAAALAQGAIYFTRDGGVTWQLQAMPDNAQDVSLWKVSFVGARR